MNLREAAFEIWLDERLGDALQPYDEATRNLAHVPKREQLSVEIDLSSKFNTRAEAFLMDEVAGQLANLVNNIGGAQAFLVHGQTPGSWRPEAQRPSRIELSSVFAANRVLVNARVFPRINGLCSWAGRTSIDPNKYIGHDQTDLNAFVGQIISALSKGLDSCGSVSFFQTIQGASTMLFFPVIKMRYEGQGVFWMV